MSDALMAQVKSTIVTCTNCWLHKAGNGPVPYRGPAPAKLVIIGEAPGDVEDKERQPFVGRAGKWMQRAISDTHINLAHVGWCNVVSCVAEGTSVSMIGDLSKVYKRWYSGPVVRIKAGFNELTITPNHPVLTRRGWIPAGDLVPERDHILLASPGERVGLRDPQVVNEPSFVDDLASALAIAGVSHRVVDSDMNFHGDGMKPDVQVVPQEGLLMDRGHVTIIEPRRQRALQASSNGLVSELGLGSGLHGSLGDLGRSWTNVGTSLLGHGLSGLSVDPLEASGVGLGSSAKPDVVVDESLLDRVDRHAEPFRDLVDGPSRSVPLDDVVHGQFEGHVYNFSTSSETYAAEGMIVHNCWPGKTKKGYRVPAIEERAACETNLKMQLVAADPYLVILAGGTALNAFRPDLKITQVRGRPFWLPGHRGVLALPTFHPAAVLRVHELKALMAKDLRQARWRLRRLERGISQSSRWPEDCTICNKPVEHYDRDGLAWCDRHVPVDIDNDSSAVPQTLDV